ncbi:uncharacterized protein METZ01_LOCUS86734 [marine metagenome]|uniref:Uncharacterized protein n=1 Tax=marine metagenome TaxID=408172 RepID=A0A381V0J7_9ZZZZ
MDYEVESLQMLFLQSDLAEKGFLHFPKAPLPD